MMVNFEKEILEHVRQHPACDRGSFDTISPREAAEEADMMVSAGKLDRWYTGTVPAYYIPGTYRPPHLIADTDGTQEGGIPLAANDGSGESEMTMEELVQQLAALQARQKMEEDAADETSAWVDGQIEDAETRLEMLNTQRDELRKSHIDPIKKVIEQIVDVQREIIEAWNPETMKKTMQYPDGTLKFRTTQSLKIGDDAWLLSELLRTMPCVGAVKYLKGFNSTAVKKFMGVHEIPAEAAEIEYKTTVKLESEG